MWPKMFTAASVNALLTLAKDHLSMWLLIYFAKRVALLEGDYCIYICNAFPKSRLYGRVNLWDCFGWSLGTILSCTAITTKQEIIFIRHYESKSGFLHVGHFESEMAQTRVIFAAHACTTCYRKRPSLGHSQPKSIIPFSQLFVSILSYSFKAHSAPKSPVGITRSNQLLSLLDSALYWNAIGRLSWPIIGKNKLSTRP